MSGRGKHVPDSRLRGNDLFCNAVSESLIPAKAGIQSSRARTNQVLPILQRTRGMSPGGHGQDLIQQSLSKDIMQPAQLGHRVIVQVHPDIP
ncbi:hypothetical protein SAMN05660653_01503 [Desulfonatronum thiosulfatophilum]|uniref:Uncharacterized protein n=1 Tax=Desulfonatronum thiosulfatophilum TaxID=617002 RepID=A0A1G6CDJ5_9BACT|nr:hypothetical protein SAMN05660653_01503 [Desulfonatronum thiosulfatophilum]